MKEIRMIMGMPVTLEVVGGSTELFETVFGYFTDVDRRFSTYKPESEISRINRGEISNAEYSTAMQEIFALSEITKQETDGYFDIRTLTGSIDPSGLVKGWAISNAARILREHGHTDFWVEAGGDIQVSGHNAAGAPWKIGIRNPFNYSEIVKVLEISNGGVATSGSYIRGAHIYDPHSQSAAPRDIVSITVVASDIYDADRFATAAFAMGKDGIYFLESMEGIEGYVIDVSGKARLTSGFRDFVKEPVSV